MKIIGRLPNGFPVSESEAVFDRLPNGFPISKPVVTGHDHVKASKDVTTQHPVAEERRRNSGHARNKALVRVCSRCGVPKPATREYFGSAPGGTLRLKCRVCMNAYSSEYAKGNPGAQAQRNQTRVLRGGHVDVDVESRLWMLGRQNGKCMCCGRGIRDHLTAQIDHGTPVARGGTHDLSNLFLAHQQCNAEKANKTLDEHWAWRKKVGLKGRRPVLGA